MGVPKFYRYISERYPCLSEIVKEYQIPEFDNLYLDMNGIIHMCSHPDDENPSFRITEDKIFKDIFHYIELLFRMIQPQKLFFMAIDGVAPRAKMNQQRGRRFRTAKDAEIREAKAKAKGEKLPTEARFDSNCITPGTVFMARLHEQLQYFIVNKISTDKLWKKCQIILSGHETPGEGEHKIMDYIRYMKSQPGYDPNTRHCLYGLDADLIMLGLCTHEPHFSLLREEVKFNKKANRSNIPEETTFHLLHLSLMREYIESEFYILKKKLPFEFDVEKIIDDWVLMGFLVGNDFIPHLPNMHIANGALAILYKAYVEVLPKLEGYINESGKLNLERFEKYMEVLSEVDHDKFQETYEDLKYFESKTGRKINGRERTSYKSKLQEWKPDELADEIDTTTVMELKPPIDSQLVDLIKSTDDMFSDDSDEDLTSSLYNDSDNDIDFDLFNAEFKQHKTDYYMNKLEYEKVTPEVLKSQAECYVRAIQWNLHYYYDGVCSWSWFYPHHYAPYISDIKGFSELELKFEIGKPFFPFQQLLAVLPAASKILLPIPYQNLMTAADSPIITYYPEDFQTDLNGKRQEWEAVVLLPFIIESELLDAMKPLETELTAEEVKRNSHGPMLVYEYTKDSLGPYSAPDYFPDIRSNHAQLTRVWAEEIRVPEDKLIKGVCPGVKTDIYFPGFPTFKHLKYSSELRKASVRVFDSPSRGDNMIVLLNEIENRQTLEELAENLIGRTIFVGWPHLTEAKVISVADQDFQYSEAIRDTNQKYNIEENKGNLFVMWNASRKGISEHYMNRLGVEIGNTEILIYALSMTGRKYIFGPGGKITLEKQWAHIPSSYAFQAIVQDITVYDPGFVQYKTITDVYPVGSECFMLGHPYYGSKGQVIDNSMAVTNGRVKISVSVLPEPDFISAKELEEHVRINYMPTSVAAQRLGMSPLLLSRITGTMFVISGVRIEPVLENASKTNIGLNMKFNKHREEIPGYTKKDGTTWLYSAKAIKLVQDYMEFCPELFRTLSGKERDNYFFEAELFPNEADGERLKQIVNWIKSQPYSSIQRRLCGTKLLEPDVVLAIERAVDYLSQASNYIKTVTMQVKPYLLYKPDISVRSLPPDPKASYHLYDRIVNVRESHTVPFASKGTVIAIHENNTSNNNSIKKTVDKADWSYDVIFDQPFVGGLPLNCSNNKGYKMWATDMINLSYGTMIEQKKDNPEMKILQPSQKQNWRQPTYIPNPQSPHSAFASWNQQNRSGNIPQTGNISNCYNQFSISNQNNSREQFYQKSQMFFPNMNQPNKIGMQQNKNINPGYPIPFNQNIVTNPQMISNTQQPVTLNQNREINTAAGIGNMSQALEGAPLFISTPVGVSPNVISGAPLFISKSTEGSQNVMSGVKEFQAMWDQLNQIQKDKDQPAFTNNIQQKSESSQNANELSNENTFQPQAESKQVTSPRSTLQNFFPSFSMKSATNEVDCKSPQILSNPHNEKGALDSTEILKMMLRITDDNKIHTLDKKNDEPNNSSHLTNSIKNSHKISVKDLFQQNKEQSSTAVVKAQESLCVQLLNMYQSYGLGIPRYNYINSSNGTIRAQVTLPDGRTIMSSEANSRELASESAAGIVLMEMKRQSVVPTQQMPYLPSPPRQWYQKQYSIQNQHNQSFPQTNFNRNENIKSVPNIRHVIEKKQIHSTPPQIQGNSPFVPLQAVKQQRSKTSINSTSYNSKTTPQKSNSEELNKVEISEENKKDMTDNKNTNQINKFNNPPKSSVKKVKKSRIAANFNFAKQD